MVPDGFARQRSRASDSLPPRQPGLAPSRFGAIRTYWAPDPPAATLHWHDAWWLTYARGRVHRFLMLRAGENRHCRSCRYSWVALLRKQWGLQPEGTERDKVLEIGFNRLDRMCATPSCFGGPPGGGAYLGTSARGRNGPEWESAYVMAAVVRIGPALCVGGSMGSLGAATRKGRLVRGR